MANARSRCGVALAGALLAVLLMAPSVGAQTTSAPAPPPAAAPAPPADALGRDTPRSALLGFMRAARQGNDDVAYLYLDTPQQGQAARDLARQLYIVLDRRLPARLTELSDQPEGSRTNPLRPELDVIGTIVTDNGQLEIVVEHMHRGTEPPYWVFSRQTLDAIPDVYREIDLIPADRYLPGFIARPRVGGVRVLTLVVLALLLPLLYRSLAILRLPGSIRLLMLAVAIHWLTTSVDLPLRERQLWSTLAAMLFLVSIVGMLMRLNARAERYVVDRFRDPSRVEVASLVRLVRRITDVLLVVAGVLVALQHFGLDPTAALAGLGIGGIAVALAAQKTLENVIGGLSLIFDKAVRVGDFLKVGEIVGTVDSIGLRSTRLRTLDRTILSVPNGQVANATLETMSVRDKCWFRHVLGLQYGTTAAQLSRIMGEIRTLLGAHASVDTESIRVRLFRFGPSSLDIELFAYVVTKDWGRFLEIQEELLMSVMGIVEGAGAAIAFPTQTLHIAADQRQPGEKDAASERLPVPASPYAIREQPPQPSPR
jgi:MscS family membrane protein